MVQKTRLGKVIKRKHISTLDGSTPMLFFHMKLLQEIELNFSKGKIKTR